jgi:Flp pilus assembly pilin Flp
MTFFANIKNFAADESGAVTVDWVVLTAAIVGLGIAVVTSVRGGVQTLGTNISTSLTTGTVTGIGNVNTTP